MITELEAASIGLRSTGRRVQHVRAPTDRVSSLQEQVRSDDLSPEAVVNLEGVRMQNRLTEWL